MTAIAPIVAPGLAASRGEARAPLSPPRPEFLRLHHMVEAQRASGQSLVLMFVAAQAGEGASCIADGYAAVSTSQPGATLLLRVGDEPDLDRRDSRPGLVDAFRQEDLALAIRPQTADAPALARLGAAATTDELAALAALLRTRFRTVVIDAPPVLSRPEALPLCRVADGIVLVVRAEVARIDTVREARLQLERAGGTVIGSVFNRARATVPGWLEKLL